MKPVPTLTGMGTAVFGYGFSQDLMGKHKSHIYILFTYGTVGTTYNTVVYFIYLLYYESIYYSTIVVYLPANESF